MLSISVYSCLAVSVRSSGLPCRLIQYWMPSLRCISSGSPPSAIVSRSLTNTRPCPAATMSRIMNSRTVRPWRFTPRLSGRIFSSMTSTASRGGAGSSTGVTPPLSSTCGRCGM